MSLKTKLIGAFLVVAILSSLTIFIGNQIAFRQIREDVLPALSTVETVSRISRALQAETLEYVATGEEETLEEIEETREELETVVAELLALNASGSDAQTYTELANNIEAMAADSVVIIESHVQTLEEAEELEDKENALEDFVDAVAGQLEGTQAEAFAEVIDAAKTLQLEALEFLATGEEETVEEFGESEQALQDALAEFANTLNTDQAELLDTLTELSNELAFSSGFIVASHADTLEQLEELEDVEQAFSATVREAELLVDANVNAGLNNATTYTIVISIIVLVVALIIGFVLANTITRPVTHLVNTTQKLAEGDYEQRAEVESSDEIGELATSFNTMAEAIQARDKEIQEANEKLVRQEKLAILGQLAGGVGHELRNPLAAIKNGAVFLEMAIEDPDPMIQETLDIMNKEVASSEHIINSLLDFARPKEPAREQISINENMRGTISRISIPAWITLKTQFDEQLPQISADPQQVHQVFDNIIRNAVQAMPEGGDLSVTTLPSEPNSVSIIIADTGQGMSQETVDKLFEPLFTTKAKGIGLGMAVTKSLVTAHHGTIEVESEPGQGTTFTIQLPINDGGGQ